MLRLHLYYKQKKSSRVYKRSKPLNLAAGAAKSGGGNRNTKTNSIVIRLIF